MVTGMQAEGMNRLVRSLISLRNQTGVRRVRLHLAKTTETDNVREAGSSSCGIQVENRLISNTLPPIIMEVLEDVEDVSKWASPYSGKILHFHDYGRKGKLPRS